MGMLLRDLACDRDVRATAGLRRLVDARQVPVA
jgi:hypothetical protein